jgi:hypothetical protein
MRLGPDRSGPYVEPTPDLALGRDLSGPSDVVPTPDLAVGRDLSGPSEVVPTPDLA